MKVAVVGVGGMGSVHLNIYKNMPEAELVALCDLRLDMLKEKAEGTGARLYSDFDELLKNEKPELIDICTPTYLHAEQTIKALKSGVNVLCEKPMALNSEQTAQILEAGEKSGKLFMTAHVVRFMNAYEYLAGVIKSGKYGKLLRLTMKRESGIPRWSYENWMMDRTKSGHVMMDLMIHDIDFAQSLFGEPQDINGVYYDFNNDSNFAQANYCYDGFVVSIETGWYKADIEFEASYCAYFENGYVFLKEGKVIDCGSEVDLSDTDKIGESGINISNADGYSYEIAYFMDCINKQQYPALASPESAALSVSLVEKTLQKMKLI